MTAEERRSLAEQITTNPLFAATLSKMERDAIAALIREDDPEHRHAAQLYVRAVQKFQRDLARTLASKPREQKSPR